MATQLAVQDDEDIDLSAGLVPHSHPTHPAGRVSGFDEETGLPIVKRNSTAFSTSNNVEKPEIKSKIGAEGANHNGILDGTRQERHADRSISTISRIGEDDATDRDILHQSTDRESLVQQAKDAAPQFEADLKAAIKGIDGTKFDAVREEKTPDRLTEKIEKEEQPIDTIPDILAGRIGVDTPEAHEQTIAAIKDSFDVVRDVDEFEKGNPDTGFRVHKLQVRVTPELSAEVHIVPKEVLAVNERQHGVYEDARSAEIDGDEETAEKKGAKAKAINDAAMAKFNERNGVTKYKFGSTQANVPEGSDAHRSIKTAQDRIDDDDLMGDGKDVDKPHVTVRYGIQGDDHEKLKQYLSQQAPFHAKLGKTASFSPSQNSDGAAPIIAPVESLELHRMNAEIEQHADFKKSDFPDYKPHVTVAYVKPEAAKKYAGMADTEGKTFHVKSVAISDRHGNHHEVPLKGVSNPQSKGDSGLPPEQAGATESAPVTKDRGKIEAEGGDGRSEQVRGSDSGKRVQEPSDDNSRTSGSNLQRPPSSDHPESGKHEVRAQGQTPQASFKVGDRVTLPDGKPATVAYVPAKSSQLPTYRLKTDDGKTVEMRAREMAKVEPAEQPSQGVILVDLDGTLAHYSGFKGPTNIGSPIPRMVDRVKRWLASGEDVRIFTARIDGDKDGATQRAIEAWSKKHIGQVLPVTNIKDKNAKSIWDDRAVQVERNEGAILGSHKKAVASA